MNKKSRSNHLDNEQEMNNSENMHDAQSKMQEKINESDNVAEDEDDNSQETQDSEKDELTILKEKNAELNDRFLRLSAEFDNYRKRMMKDRADLLKTAGEKVITDILPVIDNMERALESLETELKNDVSDKHAAVLEGVKLIHADILRILSSNNVKEIEAIGKKFDGDIHEAVTSIPAQTEEDKDKIIDCIQKGYTLGDKIIRYPKVVVAK